MRTSAWCVIPKGSDASREIWFQQDAKIASFLRQAAVLLALYRFLWMIHCCSAALVEPGKKRKP